MLIYTTRNDLLTYVQINIIDVSSVPCQFMMPHALIKNYILKLIVKCYQTFQSKKSCFIFISKGKKLYAISVETVLIYATEGNTKRQINKLTLNMTEMLEFIQSLLKIHITPIENITIILLRQSVALKWCVAKNKRNTLRGNNTMQITECKYTFNYAFWISLDHLKYCASNSKMFCHKWICHLVESKPNVVRCQHGQLERYVLIFEK